MDAEKYWNIIYATLEAKGISITDFAKEIGFKRETIYTQRRKGIIPRGEQVLAMQEYLGLIQSQPKQFEEYLPYLEKAEDWKIKAIRELLGMPDKKTEAKVI